MKHIFVLLPLAALSAVGCGAKEQGAEHPHGKDGHAHEEGGHEHGHPHLAGAVKDLHGVLAPVFHMEKGPARNEAACAKVASFKEKSLAVVSEAKPDVKASAEALSQSAGELEAACASGDKATVEPKFEAFHDAFHRVMDASK